MFLNIDCINCHALISYISIIFRGCNALGKPVFSYFEALN